MYYLEHFKVCVFICGPNYTNFSHTDPLYRHLFLQNCGRAAVPHAAGVRRQAHPHGPVDRHGGGGLPAAGAGAGGRADFVRHLWPGAGLRRDRHQQHGRRHDARSRQHAAALF